jgi:hypothetical protein
MRQASLESDELLTNVHRLRQAIVAGDDYQFIKGNWRGKLRRR